MPFGPGSKKPRPGAPCGPTSPTSPRSPVVKGCKFKVCLPLRILKMKKRSRRDTPHPGAPIGPTLPTPPQLPVVKG